MGISSTATLSEVASEPLNDFLTTSIRPRTARLSGPRKSGGDQKKLVPTMRRHGYGDDIHLPRKGSVNLGRTNPHKRENRAQRKVRDYLDLKMHAELTEERRKFRSEEGVEVTTQEDIGYDTTEPPLISMSTSAARERHLRLLETRWKATMKKRQNPYGLSLSKITAQYMEMMKTSPEAQAAREQYSMVFLAESPRLPEFKLRKSAYDYLELKGYNITDVESWADVMTSQDGREALRKLELLMRRKSFDVPRFLFTHILLREGNMYHTEVRTILKLLITYFEHDQVKFGQLKDVTFSKQGTVMDSLTKTLIIIRLTRLTHKHAPSCLPAVFRFYIEWVQKYLNSANATTSLLSNYLLHAVSSPSPNPHPHALHLQFAITAQYDLLESMARLNPPILLSRKGLRGLVRTRLASEKTQAEREHVSRMSDSWPPWPAVHDGWKENRKNEFKDQPEWTTSAGKIISEMEKAGYALQNWEQGALVLAGLDPTGTPTIPTRDFYSGSEAEGSSELLWAARVRATRTLSEAWDIVLDYQRSIVLEGQQDTSNDDKRGKHLRFQRLKVYKELFRKMIHVQKSLEEEYEGFVEQKDLMPVQEPVSGFLSKLKLALRGPDTPVYQPSEPHVNKKADRLYTKNTIVRGPLVLPGGLPRRADPLFTTFGDALEVDMTANQNAHSESLPSLADIWIAMAQDDAKPDISLLADIIEHSKSVEELTYVVQNYVFKTDTRLSTTQEANAPIAADKGEHNLTITEHTSKRDYWLTIWGQKFGKGNKAKNPRPQKYLNAFIKSLGSLDWPENITYVPHIIKLLHMYKPLKITPYKAVLSCLLRVPAWGPFYFRNQQVAFNDTIESKFQEEMQVFEVRGYLDAHKLIWHVYELASAHPSFQVDLEMVHLLIRAADKNYRYQEERVRRTDGEDNKDLVYNMIDRITAKSLWSQETPTSHVISIFEKLTDLVPYKFSSDDMTRSASSPPSHIPRSNYIHQYLRLLLITEYDQFQPLFRLIRWMIHYQEYLELKQSRLALIAIRYFLDDECGRNGSKTSMNADDVQRAQLRKDTLIQVTQMLNEGLHDWGGAATVQEVDAYAGTFE